MRIIYNPEVLSDKKGSSADRLFYMLHINVLYPEIMQKHEEEETFYIEKFKAFLEKKEIHMKKQVTRRESRKVAQKINPLIDKMKVDSFRGGTLRVAAMLRMKFLYQHQIDRRSFMIKVGESFGKVLSGLTKKIPLDRLELNKIFYFILPKGIQTSNLEDSASIGLVSKNIIGAYVTIMPLGSGTYSLMFSPDLGVNKSWEYEENSYLVFLSLDDDGNVSVDLDGFFSGNEQRWITSLARLFINGLLYLNSEDAEIDSLKPLSQSQLNSKQKHKGYTNSERLSLPVKRLYWKYSAPVYTCGEVSVATHMRWQPCGPQNSQVKLIWVKPHTRNYNKEIV